MHLHKSSRYKLILVVEALKTTVWGEDLLNFKVYPGVYRHLWCKRDQTQGLQELKKTIYGRVIKSEYDNPRFHIHRVIIVKTISLLPPN